MTRVTIDETLKTKLKSLSEQLEFCKESGETVGHFLPDDADKQLLYGSFEIPFSGEEMERRQNEPGGRPLAEIWRSLGQS